LALAACSSKTTVVTPPPEPRLVSIEVEVYDPLTDLVWEGVAVRLVEAWTEWSDLVVQNPDPVPWNYTDQTGIAFFTAADVGHSRLGFVEDDLARAVLEPDLAADQAVVLIELSAEGFRPLYFEVELDWDNPAVFVSVPFEP
jgi:hypothetical protein